MTTKKRLLVSAAGFLAGALPLLIYNLDNRWSTFSGNLQRDPAGIAAKAPFLLATVQGNGLFGWMTLESWQTQSPHEPQGTLQRASEKLSGLAGEPRSHFLLYAFVLAVLIAPLGGWRTLRMVLFGLIALAVAWVQMAITANTGASVHHTILLWPLPQFVVAVSFAGVSQRLGRAAVPALLLAMTPLLISGVLVMNEYHKVAVRYGGGQSWTDAIFNLSDYLKDSPAKNLYCLDWGILDQLRLLHAGRLPLAMASDAVAAEDRRFVGEAVADPRNVFLAHTKEYEYFPGHKEKLKALAAEIGYEPEMLRIVPDNYGRNVYEVYRFRVTAR